MLKESDAILHRLITRIPELEWKLREIGTFISNQSLPKGLFRATAPSASVCIKEIKEDIHALSQQENELVAYYLAERIRQKINILVVLCKINYKNRNVEEKVSFGIKMLSTRQKWIHTLEAEIDGLNEQKKAITNTLEQMNLTQHSIPLLHLKSELGEIERRLTIAKETLNRVSS